MSTAWFSLPSPVQVRRESNDLSKGENRRGEEYFHGNQMEVLQKAFHPPHL